MRNVIVIVMLMVFSMGAEAGEVLNYSGKKVEDYYASNTYDLIILNYWASYCLPCKKEMPDLNKLYNKYKDENVLVLGASIDSEKKESFIKKIIKKLKVDYPILYGLESKFQDIEVAGLPKTFVLNKNGDILKEIEGKRDFEYFASIIEEYKSGEFLRISDKIENKKELDYYIFSIEKNKKEIIVSLKTKEGVHLNGPNYPSIKIELENENVFSDKKVYLSIRGLDEKEEKIWKIEDVNSTEGERINIRVEAIACTENSCALVKDKFYIDL